MKHQHSTLVLALCSLVLAACAPAASRTVAPTALKPTAAPPPTTAPTSEPVSLKVGVLTLLSNAPLYLARDAGYFGEQGLDVEFVTFGANFAEITPALIQGQLDVAATTVQPSTLSAIAQGSNLKFVADKGVWDPNAPCAADALVARTELIESGRLSEPDGLRGLRLTPGTATVTALVLERILNDAGLTMEDVTPTEVADIPSRVEALRAGTLDVTALGEPWVTRAVDTGAGEVWIENADVFPNFSSGTLLYGPGMLARDPDVGVRFMVAYLKGVGLFRQGKTDSNVETIAAFTQLDPAEVHKVCWTTFREDGTIDTKSLQEYQAWAVGAGQLDAVLPIDQIYDPSFVERAAGALGK